MAVVISPPPRNPDITSHSSGAGLLGPDQAQRPASWQAFPIRLDGTQTILMSEDGPVTAKPLSVPHRLLSRKKKSSGRTSVGNQTSTTSGRVTKSSPLTSTPRRTSWPDVPAFPVMAHKKATSTAWKAPQPSVTQLIETLNSHRVNTLTELCRIERIAATCSDPNDAKAFQKPMTTAWIHYVTSQQFVTELRGLTPNYPITGDLVRDAYSRVREDPNSNRSWNLAWLCLTKMKDDGLVAAYAALEAMKPEMWGNKIPSAEDVGQLANCFESEWMAAVDMMLRHWAREPTWC